MIRSRHCEADIKPHWEQVYNIALGNAASIIAAGPSTRHHIVLAFFDQDRELVALGPQISPIVGVYSLLYFI